MATRKKSRKQQIIRIISTDCIRDMGGALGIGGDGVMAVNEYRIVDTVRHLGTWLPEGQQRRKCDRLARRIG